MSKGYGKWQRLILACLTSKQVNTDYRRVNAGSSKSTGLIERKYPELWFAKDNGLLEQHPLESGWVSVADLKAICEVQSMADYKALLRALDLLEKAEQLQSENISSPRMRLVRLKVDTSAPLATDVNTY